jgi:hypothetical protein
MPSSILKRSSWLAAAVALQVAFPARCPAEAPASEWTLEQARKCWQGMVRPVQHVGVPGYQFQAAVFWDGALVFGPLAFRELKVMQDELAPLGETRLHVSALYGSPPRFIDRRGSGDPAIQRSLEDGRCPMPRVVTRDGELLWEERVFAHLLDRRLEDGMDPRPEDVLVVHAIFTVENTGPAPREGRLWLHFGDTSHVQLGYKCSQKDDLAPAIEHRYEEPLGWVGDKVRYVLPAPREGQVRWHREPATAPGTPPGAVEWAVPLRPGRKAALRVLFPYGLVERKTAERMARLDSLALLEETRKSWKRLIEGPGQILTPDPFVNDYLAAVAGQMCQQVAYRSRSGLWMYKTSPNHYEGYWPCNAAKALPTFDFRGLSALSRPVLHGFLEKQSDDVRNMEKGVMGRDEGLRGEGFARVRGFLGNFGEWTANPLLLSHGLGMWALASHYRITRDDRWLGSGPGSPLDALLAAMDWVAVQRRRTMREEGGKKVAHWGLLPAASAHDWLAGNTIFNDAFCAYGMAEVVRLLREIQHPRAEELGRELADYRAAIRDRYREARDRALPVPLAGGPAIPYVPRMVQELDWRKIDWTYTGYGPLRAGAWGALDPQDELVSQALTFLEAGMPKGEGPYFSAHRAALEEAGGRRPAADANWADISDPAAERHHLWRHYVEYETMWPIGGPLFLARDDLGRFFEWLFNNLAAALHEDWRVGVESLDGVPSCAPGDGERWQCVRRMFVSERGGHDGSAQDLWLLQAIPRCWLRPGSRLGVREMGTCFGGKVDLEARVGEDGSVEVQVEWRGLAVQPRAVILRIRSGDGRPLRQARVDGVDAPVGHEDTLNLPAATSGRHHVVGTFE